MLDVHPLIAHVIGQLAPIPPLDCASPSLAALHAPQAIPDAILQDQFTWWALAIGLGAVLWILGWRRADIRIVRTAQITLALALLWILAGLGFDTPAERLHKAHKAISAAAQNRDLDGLLIWMAPRFTAGKLGIRIDSTSPDIRAIIGQLLDNAPISRVYITAYEPNFYQSDRADTRVAALVDTQHGTVRTAWRITWRDDPEANWRMLDADILEPDLRPGILGPGGILP